MKKVLFFALALMACSPDPDDKLVPKKTIGRVTDDLGEVNLFFNPQVDILFIVDNSYSMDTHQDRLSRNIPHFTNEFMKYSLLDYHIGVVTTDMYSSQWSGRLQGSPLVVDRSTPNAASYLARNILVGVGGDGYEKHFAAIGAALSPQMQATFNAGFYREDALLALLFITDTDDQSAITGDQLYADLLVMKKGDPSKLISYGVIIPVVDRQCDRSGEEEPYRLEYFLNTLMKGGIFGLCDPDFGQKLAEFGKDLMERVGMLIRLNRAPVVETIEVKWGSQVIPHEPKSGWTYVPDEVAIRLGEDIKVNPEPPGTRLSVNYEPAVYK